MYNTPQHIYDRINNDIYEEEGDRWWQPEFNLHLIKTLYNPFRIEYSKKVFERVHVSAGNKEALEVGSGGGLFTEEIYEMGFSTTGIDPSERSLNTAIKHASQNNLKITYVNGHGESLPFKNDSFDVVFCCDVLEHVQDVPKVISEISRVLKPGGVFIYDTFNRTFFSRISAIKILQQWKPWAILPADLHVWEMFIKPEEMKVLLMQNNLEWKEHRGIKPNVSYVKMLHILCKRGRGKISNEEFAAQFQMVECKSTKIMYVGYAVKKM